MRKEFFSIAISNSCVLFSQNMNTFLYIDKLHIYKIDSNNHINEMKVPYCVQTNPSFLPQNPVNQFIKLLYFFWLYWNCFKTHSRYIYHRNLITLIILILHWYSYISYLVPNIFFYFVENQILYYYYRMGSPLLICVNVYSNISTCVDVYSNILFVVPIQWDSNHFVLSDSEL